MASKEFTAWLEKQKHKPGDKITNLQRLTSKYLVPKGVTTWGEWYEQAGVTPPTVEEKGKKEEPKYVGSLKERVEKAKAEQAELEEARKFSEKKNRDQLTQREATAMGDMYDRHATALKPQIEEYEFKLDLFARKIARGDKLTALEEKEVDDITKKYNKLKKSYNEARQDAVDMYYGRIETPVTKTGKEIAAKASGKKPDTSVVEPASVAAEKPATPATPAATPAVTPDKVQTPAKPKVPAKDTPRSKTTATERERESGQLLGTVDAAATADKQASASKAINAPDLGLSEALFKNVPSLKVIYDEYVNPKSGMTDEEFIKRVRQDTWFLKNSKEIRARFTQFYNYQDLQASGQADGSTDYEQQIAKIESRLKKRAVELGSAAASDPIALRKAAENLYITNKSEDESYITDFLASAIRPVSGMIGGKVTEGYSGDALKNYNALLGVARNNGFQIKDILPGAQNEQQVLSAIARGEIDINRVAQDARKLAAQGQPQYVRDLLSQGYDLAQVYAPYRQQMAAVLEIQDPNQIDLNDPILRSAITDKGDMNLYDFKKALRQDSRWQYTENAKQEVSDAALGVLRDFGFQG